MTVAGATAVFLTHRRGTAIAIWDLEAFAVGADVLESVTDAGHPRAYSLVDIWLDEARKMGAAIPSTWSPSPHERELLGAAIQFLKRGCAQPSDQSGHGPHSEGPVVTSGLGVWLSAEPTAETLWLHFRELCRLLGLDAAQLGHIVFGGGPVGSFTGLRLGAAFAGGLAIGCGKDLHAVPTFAVLSDPSAWMGSEGLGEKKTVSSPRFADQIMDPIEVFAAMATVLGGGMVLAKAESLHYASEPGPVLTMRNKSTS